MDYREILSYFPVVVILIASLILGVVKTIKDERRRDLELKESKEIFTKNEAHPIRELNESEREDLKKTIKTLATFKIYAILAYIIILPWVISFSFEVLKQYIFMVFPVLSVPLLWAIYAYQKSKRLVQKIKADLVSPVYLVQGLATKEIHGSNRYRYTLIYIREEIFTTQGDYLSGRILKEIDSGEEIAIEYSPNSKKIWKLTRKN